jgi:hypothetical protein
MQQADCQDLATERLHVASKYVACLTLRAYHLRARPKNNPGKHSRWATNRALRDCGRAKDGRLIDVSLTVSPIKDEDGRVIWGIQDPS